MDLIEILTIVLITFVFTAAIMPMVIKIAKHIGAVDKPNDERKIHFKSTPALGGLGIFFGLLFGYMVFGVRSVEMIAVLIGSFIIVLTGIADDIKPISAKTKLFGQIAAALVIVVYGNIVMTNVDAFGVAINFGIFSYPVTVLFIVAIVNCMNLIDGLDGLSGGISAIYFLTIGIIASFGGIVGSLDVRLTFIMLGATLAFLLYNFNPAKIFAGDTGSMLFGFIISVIALLGFKNVTMTSLVIPLFLLAIPILDTLFAIIRRKLKGQHIYLPDKSHFHHQILKREPKQTRAVLVIYAIDILLALATIFYVLKDRTIGIIIYIILIGIFLWFIFFTDIITSKNLTKKK